MALCNHETVQSPTGDELAMVKDMIDHYTFPNTPSDDEQEAAYDKAVDYQWAHVSAEHAKIAALGQDVPANVSGFTAAGFSMSFFDQYRNGVTKNDICPLAHSVLLRAGLLYRGVRC